MLESRSPLCSIDLCQATAGASVSCHFRRRCLPVCPAASRRLLWCCLRACLPRTASVYYCTRTRATWSSCPSPRVPYLEIPAASSWCLPQLLQGGSRVFTDAVLHVLHGFDLTTVQRGPHECRSWELGHVRCIQKQPYVAMPAALRIHALQSSCGDLQGRHAAKRLL